MGASGCNAIGTVNGAGSGNGGSAIDGSEAAAVLSAPARVASAVEQALQVRR